MIVIVAMVRKLIVFLPSLGIDEFPVDPCIEKKIDPTRYRHLVVFQVTRRPRSRSLSGVADHLLATKFTSAERAFHHNLGPWAVVWDRDRIVVRVKDASGPRKG
jgi:hypothetical protein